MFTGIVEETGIVKEISPSGLVIQGRTVLEGTKPGDSMSVNGACLTVTGLKKDYFTVEVMPETKRLTNLNLVRVGDPVNLERAMSASGRFGGHFVQGHVDGMGRVRAFRNDMGANIVSVGVGVEITRYLVKKCFIAVNGVSLTVIQCSDDEFSFSLVGYTGQHTNLGRLKIGDLVNIEVDILAKYIEKLHNKEKNENLIYMLDHYGYVKER